MITYQKDTAELIHELKHVNDISAFIEDNEKESLEGTLASFLLYMLEKYSSERKDIIRKAELDTTYGYQIFDGRKIPARNKILRITAAFPLTFKETQRALRLGGASCLYPRVKRDSLLIYAIEKKFSVFEINNFLYNNGEELI